MNHRVLAQPASSAGNAELQLQRGIAAYESGHFDRAESAFRAALDLDAASSDAHFCLGNTLREQGRAQEALGAYLQAVNIDASHGDAHYGLAGILRQLGRLDSAQHHYRQVLLLQPDNVDAHNNLGNVRKSMGQVKAAAASYERALQLDPGYYQAWFNLGIARHMSGELDDAITAYGEALALKPELVAAHINLGAAYRARGSVGLAIRHYQSAIGLDSRQVQGHANLAALYERTNRLELARTSIEQGLAMAPSDPSCLFIKAVILRRQGEGDAALAILEALPETGLPEEYLVRRYFEMGKLLDQRGDVSGAFQAFATGNQRHQYSAAAARVDKTRFLKRIQRARDLLIRRGANWPESTGSARSPVFLVGFPRSGTTLLDQVLDAHPGLAVLEEQPLIAALAREVEARAGTYPDSVPDLSTETLDELRRAYWQEAERCIALPPGVQLVDKMPLNIEHLALIQRLFPGARILFASRNPCDTVLSNFMQYYQLNDAMANFFSLEDATCAYRQVWGLWMQCRRDLDLAVHEVCYEALVEDMGREVQAIVEFLGLPESPAMLAFHQHARQREVINTPSYEQVFQPLYRSSLGRWEKYRSFMAPVLDDLLTLRGSGKGTAGSLARERDHHAR